MTLRRSHLSTAHRRRLIKGHRLLQEYLALEGSSLRHVSRCRRLPDACLEGFGNWAYEARGSQFLSVAKIGLFVVQLPYPHHRRRLPRAWPNAACLGGGH